MRESERNDIKGKLTMEQEDRVINEEEKSWLLKNVFNH